MFTYVVDKTTGDFIQGGPFTPSYDAATQMLVTLAAHPDLENEKWKNGNVVPKTAAEKRAWRRAYGPKDVNGFERAVQNDVFGGVIGFNTFLVKYPLFLTKVRDQKWNHVEQLVQEALAQNDITLAAYNGIRDKADAKDIPLNL